ncbi:LysR substrate-binding domain-containing protein [Roseovarius pacificus]|uniref:LysR family transcriptional regulator n=1 Tax=Roseovarius pacificus TaxID=337701 RepID=UPI002A187D41|nr:LysR substrate-binding domain-containing protein [Roseovarius pacificus]
MIDRRLDLDSVHAFVLIADLGNFTRAAEATGTTQSAISLKLKRLEEKLGSKLLERTPRYVKLSSSGAAFLEPARELLKVHDQAISVFSEARQRLTIGISDHVAGPELPALIARMNAQDPRLLIEIRIGSSSDLLQSFDRRDLDAVVARMHVGRDDGQILSLEKFGWFASPDWHYRAGEPIPIATMPEPCGVKIMASELLDKADVSWDEVFVGGGVAAVAAAVMAGIGVAALTRRMLPLGAIDVGPQLGLPALPRLPVVLHSRAQGERRQRAISALSAALKNAVGT